MKVARILVVDDEPDILLLHRLNLEAAGHDVLLAADGERALARIEADRPDLVVLDVMMPVLDGWGVLEQLGRRARRPPVLIVSAKSAAADVERAAALGVTAYLTKPFDSDSLLATIDGLLLAA
jgi:DNA-binding response OmpR family regulator